MPKFNQAVCELKRLVTQHPTDSEDIFRLYPAHKQTFWSPDRKSVIVYQGYRQYAFCLGDAIGPDHLKLKALRKFASYCDDNSLVPVHVLLAEQAIRTYTKQGYSLQKLGEEAILSIKTCLANPALSKQKAYLQRRFERLGYSVKVMIPPHSSKLLQELQTVSDEWRQKAGRVERAFAMGHFDKDLLNLCTIIVVRDESSEAVSFASLVPTFGQQQEAKYDLFRTSYRATHSTSDFLMYNIIDYAYSQNYSYLNMGLCPLVGLHNQETTNVLVGITLKILYKSTHTYSFQGSYEFKKKFGPQWRNRYVAYKGGFTAFVKGARNLDRLMKHQAKN